MRSKRNAQARVEQYLIYIGRHDLALRDVDKDFCKGYIAFLKTCTFNNGKKTLSNTTCPPITAAAIQQPPSPSRTMLFP